MRSSTWLATTLAVLVAACGGNVFVDENGGSSGAGASPSITSSSSSSVITSSVTGESGVQPCDTLGHVDVGAHCSSEGVTCSMNVCCGGVVMCEHGAWTASVPACGEGCVACGDGLFCGGGAICVTDLENHDVGYRCEIDPCPGMAETCACGAAVCNDVGLACVGPSPMGLSCTNASL